LKKMSVEGIRKSVLEVEPYVPGKTIEEVICERGLSHVIKLGSNENPYGPFPSAMKAMKAELVKLNTYPDVSFGEIKRAISGLYGLAPASVCISHGAEGMLQTLARTFIEPGDEVIIPEATYSLYAEISKLMGGDIVRVPMRDGVYVDTQAVKKALSSKTKLIWLNNPNNPTGTVFGKNAIDPILERMSSTCWMVVDEAYAEFADRDRIPDVADYIRRGYHIISVRTFSKAWGLAGARIGYSLSSAELAGLIDTVSEPFNANRVGIAGALASLRDDGGAYADALRNIKEQRTRLVRCLNEMGFHPVPSEANFVFFSIPFDADSLCEGLLDRGVIVRSCSGWGFKRSIRVTVGTDEDNSRFLDELAYVADLFQRGDGS